MAKPTEVFGKNLQAAIGDRSQAWLAKRAGTTSAMISDYIAGKTFPSLRTAERIAEALDMPLAMLIGEDAPNPAPATDLVLDSTRLTAISAILRADAIELEPVFNALKPVFDRIAKQDKRGASPA